MAGLRSDVVIFDPVYNGYRVFMSEISSRADKYELEKEFEYYGTILDCWLARNSPICFAVFKHSRDAEKCVRDLDGRTIDGARVQVDFAKPFRPRRGGPPPTPPRLRYRSRSRSRDRRRRGSPSPRRSRSPRRRRRRSRSYSPKHSPSGSPGPRKSGSPTYGRSGSGSPRGRSPREDSRSPSPGHSRSPRMNQNHDSRSPSP